VESEYFCIALHGIDEMFKMMWRNRRLKQRVGQQMKSKHLITHVAIFFWVLHLQTQKGDDEFSALRQVYVGIVIADVPSSPLTQVVYY